MALSHRLYFILNINTVKIILKYYNDNKALGFKNEYKSIFNCMFLENARSR
jgi:hypothetical protein